MTPLEASSELIDILLVDDNVAHTELVRELMADVKMRNRLQVAHDGEEAMKMLRREAPYEDAFRPDIILLDLNMPKMDGREVLQAVKADPRLRSIPVVILTTSSADEDILSSYDLQAACYLTKPLDLSRFVELIRRFEDFWIEMVRLPRKE